MSDEVKPVVFGQREIDPAEEAEYKERIRKARGGVAAVKGSDPVGSVPRPSIPYLQRDQEQELASALSSSGGVQPRPPGSPVISPQTASMLQEAADAAVRQKDEKIEEEKKEAEKKGEEDLFEMFDFGGRNEAEQVLNNRKRRKAIESRCAPMSLDDLIFKDEVQQLVPINPKKFEVLYRSMTPDENLYIKRFVAKTDQGQTDQYVLERFALCQLTCTVLAINGRALPDHRKTDGTVDDAAFETKLKMLMKKSAYIIADLGINYSWFDVRVRKLLAGDDLGNG
jgi:hypothetical protein